MRDYIKGFIDAAIGYHMRWTADDISDAVRGVLKEDAIDRWWHNPMPQYGGKTPHDLWFEEGPYGQNTLIKVVCSYHDSSFS